jgi:hypothetical protein
MVQPDAQWVKVKNPKEPAVKREAEEDWERASGANALERCLPGHRCRTIGHSGGVEWEVLHHVAWQASFKAKGSDESHNGIGSCWGVVVDGRRVRGSRWSARRYTDGKRGNYTR